MMRWSKKALRWGFSCPATWAFLFISVLFSPFSSLAQDGTEKVPNKVQSILITGTNDAPVVEVRTEIPVGYRYTIYDSYDPIRIVIDLPGTDTSAIKDSIKVSTGPLLEIKSGSFDLPSGKLGRLELVLTREAKYKVNSEGTLFSVNFGENNIDLAKPLASTDSGVGTPESSLPNENQTVPVVGKGQIPAKTIKAIHVGSGKVSVDLDGSFDNFQYFHLRSPSRLVVDLYGVKPAFSERIFKISQGFHQLRVGDARDKTRLVLDAKGSFPGHKVLKEGDSLLISWDGSKDADAPITLSTAVSPEKSGKAAVTKKEPLISAGTEKAPVNSSRTITEQKPTSAPALKGKASAKKAPIKIENIDFKIGDGKSLLTVLLSAPTETSAPVIENSVVRFGIKNATISRALRRTIDASSFPSAVKRIIPYSIEGGNEIRFAVELKGIVPYSLQQDKGVVTLVVENQGFAEPVPPTEKKIIPVPQTANYAEKPGIDNVQTPAASLPVAASQVPLEVKPTVSSSLEISKDDTPSLQKKEFTGEKISLVFDDANIRNILQLIGEVSNLNIIAGEDVKGTITLRLIDVPWDQALSLILESKNLGMLQEGNVVRIMPKEQIRALRQAEMTAAKEEKQLEAVVTEVIPINYTALGNITGPAKELLTDRGKITEDARNKQVIVTDIPSSIAAVKKLATILDTPERQVMIEARIVEANSSFGRDLGVKWGLSYDNNDGGAGDVNNASIGLGGSFLIAPPTAGSVMGNAGLGSGITFGRVGIDSTVLDLRISALESAGYGKVISTPRVSTLNGGTASISQGTKIPYQSSGEDGKAKTEFVDANLSLTVQPVINPDDSIILDITATNSSIGSTVSTGSGSAPAIDTKEAKTKVIVRNGETTVIGGIFVETENTSQAGVPFLMKIPIIGHLFRSDNNTSSRSELLVFITPRIVQ